MAINPFTQPIKSEEPVQINSKTLTLMDRVINVVQTMAPMRWKVFTATSTEQLQLHMCEKLQLEMGYHPAGYGTYKQEYSYDEVTGIHTLTWQCADTGD